MCLLSRVGHLKVFIPAGVMHEKKSSIKVKKECILRDNIAKLDAEVICAECMHFALFQYPLFIKVRS